MELRDGTLLKRDGWRSIVWRHFLVTGEQTWQLWKTKGVWSPCLREQGLSTFVRLLSKGKLACRERLYMLALKKGTSMYRKTANAAGVVKFGQHKSCAWQSINIMAISWGNNKPETEQASPIISTRVDRRGNRSPGQQQHGAGIMETSTISGCPDHKQDESCVLGVRDTVASLLPCRPACKAEQE